MVTSFAHECADGLNLALSAATDRSLKLAAKKRVGYAGEY